MLEEHELLCEDLLHVNSEGIALTKQSKYGFWTHFDSYVIFWPEALVIDITYIPLIILYFGTDYLQLKVGWSYCYYLPSWWYAILFDWSNHSIHLTESILVEVL